MFNISHKRSAELTKEHNSFLKTCIKDTEKKIKAKVVGCKVVKQPVETMRSSEVEFKAFSIKGPEVFKAMVTTELNSAGMVIHKMR